MIKHFFPDLTGCIALYTIPGLLRERVSNFVVEKEQNDEEHKSYPHIVLSHSNPADSDQFSIKVDNIDILTVNDFLTAFKLMIACYYVFNIAYPKVANASMEFVQKVLMNVQDGTKISSKVLSLLAKLAK